MNIPLDKQAINIINTLESNGYTAYAVGGALRDALLGREVSDTDIASSATPSDVRRIFGEKNVIDTGLKHGTVTVLFGGKPYEVTTYRAESGYTDSRHPDSVRFVTDIESDLARRDFTVNAMAFSPKRGFVDPFGGLADLESRLIRAVGDAKHRFAEDALRILRALRFASALGFDIEQSTSNAVFELSSTLNYISAERVYSELTKLILGKNAVPIIKKYRPVLEIIAPITGDIEPISNLPRDSAMRFACLYGNGISGVLRSLRADNATIRRAKSLSVSEQIPADYIAVKKYISSLGRALSADIAVYRRTLYGEDKDKMIESILISGECLLINELAVNGADMLALGIKDTKIGETLKILLDEVIKGSVENEKSALLDRAEKVKSEE